MSHTNSPSVEQIEEEAAHKIMISMSEGRWKLLMWGFGLHFTIGVSAITFLAGWVKSNDTDIDKNTAQIAALTESVRAISISLSEHVRVQDKTLADLTESLKEDLGDISLSLKTLQLDIKAIDTSFHTMDKRMSVMESNRFTSGDAVKEMQNTDNRITTIEGAVNGRIDALKTLIDDIRLEIRALHGVNPQ